MAAVMMEHELAQRVEQELRSLYISGTLKGLYYLVYAVVAEVQKPGSTHRITKELYPEIALAFKTTPARVERDMRWAIRMAWESAKDKINQMALRHLVKRPTNREFIDIIAFHIRSV